ncbi:MAG: hypothetical protein Q4F84_00060 [Fibrobacter sp.]|nr:hypothetical protein [Fibrobacter sp.]
MFGAKRKTLLLLLQQTSRIAGSPEVKAARPCGSTWLRAAAPAFALGDTYYVFIGRKAQNGTFY